MNENNNRIADILKDIKDSITALGKTVQGIEKRLERLEKVDSIEHRVTSNQIDITDIKEALERMEELQSAKIEAVLREIIDNTEKKSSAEFKTIHKRLDSHLLKMGKVEEDILILKQY
ncbi:hypothetical protein [Bacillus sp. T33-2]|uniref:hypothetical protein n=1 Tax=Bacillus sp. T33-2 TaxID=2054168 RepID=UPI000C779B0C|nr:hypothetical protein [Bacillus sp. T33-2]PLR90073.1 hypothetical protein CVD19_22570 [Bacillus sp. T33-2]